MLARFYISMTVLLLVTTISAKSQGFIIANGAYVTASEGNILLKSNWINNGVFVHKDGIVTFNGNTQILGGSAASAFNNLTIAAGSNTSVTTSGQSLKRILLCNGTFNADSGFTLLSNAQQTALIDGSGTGSVLGNVTMQRYLPKGFGYKYFSSPFQSATVSEFSDEVNLLAAFPVFYKYDENRISSGWVNYTADTGHLIPMIGYAINFGASLASITVDVTGVVNNNSISASFANHNQAYTLGFNLAGNPYPSPIDWDASSGWTRSNIDDAVYYFSASDTNQYEGSYSSYINGVSSDGIANNIIPAMQGFFVHVSNGVYPVSGTLGINNAARVNLLNPGFYKYASTQKYPLLRISASLGVDEMSSDPLVIYFDEQATPEFDQNLDALKLLNTDVNVPSLYAIIPDSKLSINALPAMPDSFMIIPLGLQTEIPGWAHFQLKDIEQIPQNLGIYFLDIQMGICRNLQIDPEYKIYLDKGKHEGRFSLALCRKDKSTLLQSDEQFTAYSTKGKMYIILNFLSGGEGDVMITNMLGQVMLRQHVAGYGSHEFNAPWSTGIYIVSFISKGNKHAKKVFLGNG